MKFRLLENESKLNIQGNLLSEEQFIKIMYEMFSTSFYSKDMGMELICEKLFNDYGVDAKYKASGIFDANTRLFSVYFSHEDRNNYAISEVRTYNNPNLSNRYEAQLIFHLAESKYKDIIR